ncbi:MAG TPA: YbaL family putative K(+) efflux transporter [Dongiaceae bacterium]|nr:YbaL family putative K(+) efflux transporter [Dongiaceae bacterium]
MFHDAPLITTLVGAVVLAFLLGVAAMRLHLSPLAGYLLAGVAAGPFTPGFVADQNLAGQLTEIGVILLMFGIGLHFSVRDLLAVKSIVGPGAVAQIILSTLLGLGLGGLLGWDFSGALVFGLGLAVASTVVTMRALQERHLADSQAGHVAVGWLVAQDLAMVLVLVMLPALAGLAATHDILAKLAITLGKLIAFAALMLLVGRRVIPWMLHYVAHTGSRELFRLAVLAIALGVAYGAAQFFGVSLALGAFLAGVILSESELAHQAAQESLPLRDAFAVLFFVSVGMLFNPTILLREPLSVLAVLAIIMIGNTGIALGLQLLLRQPFAQACTVAASLGQIGEFSFVLVSLGVALGLLTPLGRDLVLAGAILSILLHPALLSLAGRIGPRLESRIHPPLETAAEPARHEPAIPVTALTNHTVLIGYGRVGRLVGEALAAAHRPYIVVEDRQDLVEQLRERGLEAILGNGAAPDVLKATNIARAASLVVAIPNGFEAGQISEQARAANPTIEIIARAHSDAEVEHLHRYGVDLAIMGEREIARGMIDRLLPNEDGSPAPAGAARAPA